MPFICVFQQDNDRKHMSKKAEKGFAFNINNIMEWPAQTPDVNPIENLWTDVKKAVHICNPTSNEALWMVIKESWQRIPINRYQDSVDSMSRRCAAVIANKEYSTKYKFTS